jgi:hypothetical protein
LRRFTGKTRNRRERIRGLISHWDEAENDRAELGRLAACWTDLAQVTGYRRAVVMMMAEHSGFLEQ